MFFVLFLPIVGVDAQGEVLLAIGVEIVFILLYFLSLLLLLLFIEVEFLSAIDVYLFVGIIREGGASD